jgi:hypothetical protein
MRRHCTTSRHFCRVPRRLGAKLSTRPGAFPFATWTRHKAVAANGQDEFCHSFCSPQRGKLAISDRGCRTEEDLDETIAAAILPRNISLAQHLRPATQGSILELRDRSNALFGRDANSPTSGVRFNLPCHAIIELAEAQTGEPTIITMAGRVCSRLFAHCSQVRVKGNRKQQIARSDSGASGLRHKPRHKMAQKAYGESHNW